MFEHFLVHMWHQTPEVSVFWEVLLRVFLCRSLNVLLCLSSTRGVKLCLPYNMDWRILLRRHKEEWRGTQWTSLANKRRTGHLIITRFRLIKWIRSLLFWLKVSEKAEIWCCCKTSLILILILSLGYQER
jgi:hypothetical protein